DQYGKTYERRRCTPQTQILELVVLVLEGATPIFLGSQVSLQHPVCVETFSESRALGRVFLRSSGRTVAMGRVTRIIQNS
ncbi:hypothetical protein HID58_089392, partial [Brassica napus]